MILVQKMRPFCFLKGGGKLIGLMGARQAHKMAMYLMERAKFRVLLTAYTYNTSDISEQLIKAAIRGVRVQITVDMGNTLQGAPKAQATRLGDLRRAGVDVRLTSGLTGKSGIQHSKTLLADQMMIVGSSNWTSSSKLNHEMSALVHLNPAGVEQYENRYLLLLQHSVKFSSDMEKKGESNRADRSQTRPKSCPSPENRDRYATAKRFSIARARALSRDTALADGAEGL